MLQFKRKKVFFVGLMSILIGLAFWNMKEATFRPSHIVHKQVVMRANPLLLSRPSINPSLLLKQSQQSNRTRMIPSQQHTVNATYEKPSNGSQKTQTQQYTVNSTKNATVNATVNAAVNATVNAKVHATVNATVNTTGNAPVKLPVNATVNATDKKLDVRASPQELVNLIPKPHPQIANCQKIFSNDTEEINKIYKMEEEQKKVPVPDEDFVKLAGNCDVFKKARQYISLPLTKEEEDFPIAYSIMMFKDVEQFERLLRAIYMPQNYYCIHIDSKSATEIHKAVAAITKCFDNIFLASRQVDVRWGTFTALEGDLICMEDLFKKYKKWRYFINLTGQEFPMKTNRELVRILKVLNGAVSMESTIKRRHVSRTQYVHNGGKLVEPLVEKTPVPHQINLSKGSAHVVAPREFVEFSMSNRVARDFLDWVKDTGFPDETYFSSLGHTPHLRVPGAYKGEPETDSITYPFIARYKNWFRQLPCFGKVIRNICIISVGDLPFIKDRPELFINKLHSDYSPSAYDCLEELHFQRIKDEVLGSRKLNLSYYENLDIVKNHI